VYVYVDPVSLILMETGIPYRSYSCPETGIAYRNSCPETGIAYGVIPVWQH